MQHAEHFIRLSSSLSNGHEKKNGSSQEVDKSKIEKLSDEELSQNKI